MKILVLVKRDAVYKVKVRVRSDASGVDRANVKMAMNPFVEIAVEEAGQLWRSPYTPYESGILRCYC